MLAILLERPIRKPKQKYSFQTYNDKGTKMPPRVKKVNRQKPSLSKKNENEDEKENICSDTQRKKEKNDRNSIKLQSEEIKTEKSEKGPLSPREEKLKLKTAGFWSKKVHDLELQKNVSSEDKYSLYEFNGTDESDSYCKRKKSKRKVGSSKRKKVGLPSHYKLAPLHQKPVKKANKATESEKKIKEIHGRSLFREQMTLRKERERLADGGEKFTFSAALPSLGITSTPALNKDNLIGASNFLFLSPIIKEEGELCRSLGECTPLKSKAAEKPDASPGQKIHKVGTALKKFSCRRVLRSGKVLNL